MIDRGFHTWVMEAPAWDAVCITKSDLEVSPGKFSLLKINPDFPLPLENQPFILYNENFAEFS